MRPVVTVASVVASALIARSALAGEEGLTLSWQAPAGCPSASELRDATLRTAGEATAREPIDARVRVEQTDRGERWSVTIQTTRAGITSAERRLQASSCAALADATAVVLALAMVPDERAAEPATAPAPAPLPARAPAPASPGVAVVKPSKTAASEHEVAARDPYTHALAASASLATDATSLPAPAVGGRAGVAWTPDAARIELAGTYYSYQSKTTDTSQAGAKLTLLTAGARGCWALLRGPVELSPCAGADLDIVRASGFGARANYDASAAWISAAAGALVRVPVGSWLALRAHADATAPLARPRFVVEGDGAVHQPSTFGLRGAIGAELLFL